MARLSSVVALLALTGALLTGCNNPAENEGPPDPDDWEIRDTPQHVLDNLVRAYEEKDAVHYLDCLAEDFTFVVNPNEVEDHPELEPGYWVKAEERTIHEAMFGENGAESITLTLTQDGDPIQVDGPEPGDPPEWQYTESVDLRVYVIDQAGPVTLWATAPSRFQLRVDRDQVGPNGEILWEIAMWYDLDYWRDGAGGATGTSWGSIKALYR